MGHPENSIYIIVGEMTMVTTAMKRSHRWSSHVHQEEEQDILLKNFNILKNSLNSVDRGFSDLEPNVYLTPFLAVIRSENTSGVVTGHGLSAVYKFLSCGLIDARGTSAAVAAENIADAVTHARFMTVDATSDEIVLMKIIQVLRLLLLSPLGTLLTNEAVCEIIQSFFRMCFETRFSEILRKTAESALVDTVQLLFSRLPQFTEDSRCTSIKKLKMHSSNMNRNQYNKKKFNNKKKVIEMKPDDDSKCASAIPDISENNLSCDIGVSEICSDSAEKSVLKSDCSENNRACEVNISIPDDDDDDMVIIPDDAVSSCENTELDVNVMANREVNNVNNNMLSETNVPVTDGSHSNKMYTIDLKSIGDHGENYCNNDIVDDPESYQENSDYINHHGVRFTPQQPPQEGSGSLVPYSLPCVRELFRVLVSLINPLDRRNSDITIQIGLNLIVVALETGVDNIRKFSSLLSQIKDEMCRNLFLLLSTERLTIFTAVLRVFFLSFEALRTHLKFQLEMFLNNLMDVITSESTKITYEQREISLDYLIQLWRIPSFVTELYINYDCDLYSSNLFEHLAKLLSKNAFPIAELYSVHLLSLDALLAVIDNIENHCHCRMLNKTELPAEISSTQNEIEEFIPSIIQQGVSGYHFGQQLLNDQTLLKLNLKDAKKVDQTMFIQPNRMKASVNIPSHEELMAIKHKKKILSSGTDQFNSQASKGITFLQEHGLLNRSLDPQEVATFLRNNPRLDKRMIGEYVSNRKNLKVLEAFVKSFAFESTRIDEALRQYLETFRLPGEAPLISLIMEHFAEHWHNSNKQPFANNDAAFTLAYAIIMLNVDQHNHNVKKQSSPMTIEDFKKNLKNVNGSKDFDEDMLEKIYTCIKNEEIIMPAEQTGLIKENYLWKVLLRRGNSKEGKFIHVPNGVFDHDLFCLLWGPTVAALSFIFDKSDELNVIEKTISGFHKCAMIAAHYGMCDVFDNLVISLCKFTFLVNSTENPKQLPIVFGNNNKAQIATKAVFRLAHCHGDILREGWKNLLDCVLHLFKAKLLPQKLVEAEDFLSENGVISLVHDDLPSIQRAESGLFSSFYSYITSDTPSQRPLSQEDEIAKKAALECIKECHCEQLFDETKFLRMDSLQELVKTLIFICPRPEPVGSSTNNIDEDSAVFILELLIKIVLLNRDRVTSIWPGIQDHMFSIIMNAAVTDNVYLLERTVVGILRIAIRLVCKEDMMPQVLQSLRVLLYLKAPALLLTSRQIAYALNDLLRTNAANIHEEEQWSILFSLLERVGAGAKPSQTIAAFSAETKPSEEEIEKSIDDSSPPTHPAAQSDSELTVGRHVQDSQLTSQRGYTSDSELYENAASNLRHSQSPQKRINQQSSHAPADTESIISPGHVVKNLYKIVLHSELSTHDSLAFLKCCESLAFLVRDAAHITAQNFESCVHCLRTFVEASANGGFLLEKKHVKPKVNKEKKFTKNASSKRKEEKLKRSRSLKAKSEDYDADDEEKQDEYSPAYEQASMQLLDLMHTLHTRASGIFVDDISENVSSYSLPGRQLWTKSWCPLLQGISRLCCDNRLEIRTSALSLLQRALLVHDLQTLSPTEWEACFNKVLFPLLANLLEDICPSDPLGMEETRTRGANLLCKVFLQHLTPLLTLPTFIALWLTILDFMDKYMKADFTGSLAEAIPESLKNMLLVMDTAGVFHKPEDIIDEVKDQMWLVTWDRINSFLPSLKNELFKPSVPLEDVVIAEEQMVINMNEPIGANTISIASSPPKSSVLSEKPENSFLMSPNCSVILHPPAIPPISTTKLAVSPSESMIKTNYDADIITTNAVPLLLSTSVMCDNNMPCNPQIISTSSIQALK